MSSWEPGPQNRLLLSSGRERERLSQDPYQWSQLTLKQDRQTNQNNEENTIKKLESSLSVPNCISIQLLYNFIIC